MSQEESDYQEALRVKAAIMSGTIKAPAKELKARTFPGRDLEDILADIAEIALLDYLTEPVRVSPRLGKIKK